MFPAITDGVFIILKSLPRSMATDSIGTKPYGHVSVIGAGAWGTALAAVAAGNGAKVALWAREPDVVESIRERRVNNRFLPGAKLPPSIAPTLDLARAIAGAEAILVTAPAQHLRATLVSLRPHAKAGTPLVICAKGIEHGSGLLV